MANTTKTYTIEIQMDAAQQALADTTKKLAELDASLEGLDRGSDEAKAIVAEMAKLAKSAEGAENEIGGLAARLDGLKPGTIPALKAQIEELEEAFNLTVRGTKEFDDALLALGNAKGELKSVEDAIDALNPKEKAAAFVDFGNGVVGAFGVATVAAETFGLSSQSVEEYQNKLLGAITVLSSVEQVSKALNSETLSVVKSSIAAGKAYLLGAESASVASKITRAALITTGIGAVVVLVGLLAANFDKVKEAGSSIYARFKPQFEAISTLIKSVADSVRNLASTVTFGLIDDVAKHAVKVAEETALKLSGIQIEAGERDIALRRAQGLRVEQDEIDLAKEKLSGLKRRTDEENKIYDDAQNALNILLANRATRIEAEKNAATLARLNARVTLETAKGREALAAQLAVKNEELIQLLAAETRNESAIIAKRTEIEALSLAVQKAAADKRLAAEFAAFKERNAAIEKIDKLTAQERLQRDIDAETKRLGTVAELGARISVGTAKVAEQLAVEQAERIRIAAIKPLTVGENVLVRVFGVAPDQLEATKAAIGAAADAVNQAVGQYYAGAVADADARIDEATQRVSLINQALDTNRKKQEDNEKALQTATGARRDFIISRLAKERAEEERLNAAKAKAANDEKKRIKERDQLQKESQRVSLALSAALAIEAAVSAIKEAAKMPFPANIPSIIVAGATVASGIFAAKALGNAFADGGFVTGPGGPRADMVPAVLSNGEFVVNADATAKNRALLESMNANNNRVLPPGTQALASGNSGGSADSSISADIAQLLAANQELIAVAREIAAHSRTSAEKPGLIIGPAEAMAIEQQRQSIISAEQSAAL